mmetsp:Transcript_25441/g.76691  ORF Transcript_25441/g.76691 Transcript_25441/m.76691 type:complete len:695 (-) Transcript_25441:14-2098(-)
MVLQRAPAAAAVYGRAPVGASAVTVTVSDGKSSYDVQAKVGKDATHQPYGYVDPGTGAQLPVLNNTWKAVLHPTAAGGDYTITAKCTGCIDVATAALAHVTFGDMWYCSGQSNMWLPVQYSFSRNSSVADIAAGKYPNIRGVFSASATTPTAGAWKTAEQAIQDGNNTNPTYSLFKIGATCWYFAQRLANLGVTTPIGIADTAIGGQRIEEFMNNGTFADATACPATVGGNEFKNAWNGQLFAKQVMPFVDMSVKGWLWYQGENNMMDPKGSSAFNVGYSCKQRELVKGWRAIWSETAGTTAPNAPFGLVTLASSGSEGGPNMGAMRLAQTAGYGVLPNEAIPNSFFAQAGDLEDSWGPAAGPCFSGFASDWNCCGKGAYQANRSSATCIAGTKGKPEICDPACAAAAGTPTEGGIHPRSKRPVGDRLAPGAFNLGYGGAGAATGPTLSGCTVESKSLTIDFNTTLLAGDKVVLNPYNSALNNPTPDPPQVPSNLIQCFNTVKTVCGTHLHNDTDCRNCKTDVPGAWDKLQGACGSRPINNFHVACKSFFPAQVPLRGSLLEVLIGQGGADGTAAFCVEPIVNSSTMQEYCPPWAGPPVIGYNPAAGKWYQVDITAASTSSVTADLSKLNGSIPVAVRYSWGVFDCCDTDDPLLYISKPCDNNCPITSSSLFPANPFIAKLVDGKCSCVAPQVC